MSFIRTLELYALCGRIDMCFVFIKKYILYKGVLEID